MRVGKQAQQCDFKNSVIWRVGHTTQLFQPLFGDLLGDCLQITLASPDAMSGLLLSNGDAQDGWDALIVEGV